MRHTTILGAALAVLVLAAGTAAAAPTATADRAADGPPSDLPGPVPDFVTAVLDAVGSFPSGDLDGALGPVVSDAAGNGGP